MPANEITFQVRESPEGGYEARALGYSIFTEGDDWEHLKYMLRDAVLCHFEDGEAPRLIHIHLVRDEVISV
jgi:hypothetical protein